MKCRYMHFHKLLEYLSEFDPVYSWQGHGRFKITLPDAQYNHNLLNDTDITRRITHLFHEKYRLFLRSHFCYNINQCFEAKLKHLDEIWSQMKFLRNVCGNFEGSGCTLNSLGNGNMLFCVCPLRTIYKSDLKITFLACSGSIFIALKP